MAPYVFPQFSVPEPGCNHAAEPARGRSASLPPSPSPSPSPTATTHLCLHLHVHGDGGDDDYVSRSPASSQASSPGGSFKSPSALVFALTPPSGQATSHSSWQVCVQAPQGPLAKPVALLTQAGSEKGGIDESSLPLRNQLGLISQRIKPVMGNLARRGLRYGMLTGAVLSTAAVMTAPVLGPFFSVAALAVAAAVPAILLVCLLGGAMLESVSRKMRRHRLDVEDVVKLERIYLLLKGRKQVTGKLVGEDSLAWHKVNKMLEEISGGFWRGVRMMLAEQVRLRQPCGRYRVGSVFAQTPSLL